MRNDCYCYQSLPDAQVRVAYSFIFQRNSNILEFFTRASQSPWMCILYFDVLSFFSILDNDKL